MSHAMTGRVIDFPERMFQVWGYTVSHRQLLLRSTKSETLSTRVDVLFKNVKAMCLPTLMDGLVIELADGPETERITLETGFVANDETTFFSLATAHGGSYVVAGAVFADEDSGEYFEPSRYWLGMGG